MSSARGVVHGEEKCWCGGGGLRGAFIPRVLGLIVARTWHFCGRWMTLWLATGTVDKLLFGYTRLIMWGFRGGGAITGRKLYLVSLEAMSEAARIAG